MTPSEFAVRASVSEKEANAILDYLKRPSVKKWLKRFQEFELSPSSRTMAYSDCLFLMRDPPAGRWADGSLMSPAKKGNKQ